MYKRDIRNLYIPFITGIVVVLDSSIRLPEEQCSERCHAFIDFGLRKPVMKYHPDEYSCHYLSSFHWYLLERTNFKDAFSPSARKKTCS